MYVYVHICACNLHVHSDSDACMHACMFAHVYVCSHAYLHACVCVGMQVCTYAYTLAHFSCWHTRSNYSQAHTCKVAKTLKMPYLHTHTQWQRLLGCLICTRHFCKRAIYLAALLRKKTCNLRHPMHLRHPVHSLCFSLAHSSALSFSHTHTHTHTHAHANTHRVLHRI